MSIFAALDIIIGLVFTFLILSLLASEFQEQLATIIEFRAGHLKKAITVLLGEHHQESHFAWVKSDSQHTIITIPYHFQDSFTTHIDKHVWINEQNTVVKVGAEPAPEITPNDNNPNNHLGVLKSDGSNVEHIEIKWKEAHNTQLLTEELYLNSSITDLNQFSSGGIIRIFRIKYWRSNKQKPYNYSLGPSNIPPEAFATAIFEVIQDKLPDGQKLDKEEETISSFIQKLYSLPFSQASKLRIAAAVKRLEFRRVLPRNTESADSPPTKDLTDLEKIHAEIANWFEESINRSSGVYKRNAKGLSLIVGLVIAILFNINTFNIIDALKNQPINSALSESATNVLNDQELFDNCIQAQGNPTVAAPAQETKDKCSKSIQELSEDLQANLPITVGWKIGEEDENIFQQILTNVEETRGLSLLGWLVTGGAIAMGSPFWFEILGKVVNVRNVTKKKAQGRSSEE